MGRLLIAAILAYALSGCAVIRDLVQATKAQVTLVKGLRHYDAGAYHASTQELLGALELGLGDGDRALAHKHLAFIHCASNRERQCRDEFRKALDADPRLKLEQAEAWHPFWGPIFRSMSSSAALDAGLKQYEQGDYAESAKNLQTAIDVGLPEKERANAHKHLAFIHCSSSRERQCRDEFRRALAADPALELTRAEAGHPVWGPIFLSTSGTAAFSAALKQYEQGEYAESAKNLQGAIELGVPEKLRATAHKHLAFIHCSSNRERQCRDEFRKALAVDPGLDLAPAEAGHPVWGPIFRSLKAPR
jgi:Tfp pilus assembly protein PilF